MTVIRLPNDPELVAAIRKAIPETVTSADSGPLALLVSTALEHCQVADPLAIADAIDALHWPSQGEIEVRLLPMADDYLRDLFHRVSLALPIGRRAPRMDDAAIVAGCLITYCRQAYPHGR